MREISKRNQNHKSSKLASEFLTLKEVCDLLRIGHTTCWLIRKSDETFPHPIRISKRNKWKRTDLDEYLRSRMI